MQSRSRYSCHTLFLVLYAITMQIISLIHYTPLIQVKYPFISLNFGSGDGEFVGWQGTDGSSSVFSLVSSTSSLFLSSSQCVVFFLNLISFPACLVFLGLVNYLFLLFYFFKNFNSPPSISTWHRLKSNHLNYKRSTRHRPFDRRQTRNSQLILIPCLILIV